MAETGDILAFMEYENEIGVETAGKHSSALALCNSVLSLLTDAVGVVPARSSWPLSRYYNQFLTSTSLMSVISVLRLHYGPAGQSLRTLIEAGAKAAYCVSNENALEKGIDQKKRREKEGFQKMCYAFCEGRYPQWTASIKELKTDLLDRFFAHSSINVADSGVTQEDGKYSLNRFDRYVVVNVNMILQQLCRTALKIFAIIANEAERVEKRVMDAFRQRLTDLDDQALKLGEETLKGPGARKYLERTPLARGKAK